VQGHLTASVSSDFVEVEQEEKDDEEEVEEEEEGFKNEEGEIVESKPITMHVLEAGNLAKADTAMFGMGGSSDPFIEVKWSNGKFMHKTKVKNDTQDPVWEDELVVLYVPTEVDSNKADLELHCDVWDKDMSGKGEFLGRAVFTQVELLEWCESPPKRGVEVSLGKVMTWNAAKNKLVQGTLAVGFTRGEDEDADSPEMLKKKMKHAPQLGLRYTVYKAAETMENSAALVIEDVDEKTLVFEIGEKIMGRYRGRPKWMPGVVMKVNKRNFMVSNSRETYDILYDHGAREKGVPRYHIKGVPKPEPPRPQQRLRVGLIGVMQEETSGKGGLLRKASRIGKDLLGGALNLGKALTPKSSWRRKGSASNMDELAEMDLEEGEKSAPIVDMSTKFACDMFWRGSKVSRFEGVEKLEHKHQPNAGESVMLPMPLDKKAKGLSDIKLVVRKGGGGGADGGRMKTGKFIGEMLVGWNSLSRLEVHRSKYGVSAGGIDCRNTDNLRIFKSSLLEPLPVTGQANKSYRVLTSKLAFIACMEEVQFEEKFEPVLDVGDSTSIAKMKIDVGELRWLFGQRGSDKITGRIKLAVSWCGKSIGWVRFRAGKGDSKMKCLGPSRFEVQLPRDRRGCSLLVQAIDEGVSGGKEVIGSMALDWNALKNSPHVPTFFNVLSADEMPHIELPKYSTFELFGRSNKRVLLTSDQKDLTEDGLSSTSLRRIKVTVMRCENLSKADKSIFGRGEGNSDPFVEFFWDDESIGKTPTIREDCNPVWRTKNEFVIEVDDEDDSFLKQLELMVWDEDMMTKGDFLGCVTIPAKALKNPRDEDRNGRLFVLEKKENMPASKQKLVGGSLVLKIVDMDKIPKGGDGLAGEGGLEGLLDATADDDVTLEDLLDQAADDEVSLEDLLSEAAEEGEGDNYINNELLKGVEDDVEEGKEEVKQKERKSMALLSAKQKLARATFKTKIQTGLHKEVKALAKKKKKAEKDKTRQVPTRISDLSVGLRFCTEESIRESPYQLFLGLRSAGGLAPTSDVWGTRWPTAKPLGLSRVPGSTNRFPFGALYWKGKERTRTKIAHAKVGWAEKEKNVPHKHTPTFWGDEDQDGDIDDISSGQIVLPLPTLPKSEIGAPRALFKTPKLNLGTEKRREKDTQCRVEVYDFGDWTINEIRCIETMQRAIRKYLAGAFVRILKQRRAKKARENAAAEKIQSMVRIRQAKNKLKDKKDGQEAESATKMQCLFRGKKSRETAAQKATDAAAKEKERKRLLRTVEIDVDILGAVGLAKADVGSLSDPFVEVWFAGKYVGSTKVIKDTLIPKWNESFVVEFECADVPEPVDSRPLTKVKKDRVRVEGLLDVEVDSKR